MSLIVIKVGGDIFHSDVLPAVAQDVATAIGRGDRIVMVHGGGAQATALQKRLGLIPHMVSGRRVTDEATLGVMKMVVGGQLNIDLCAALLRTGVRPIGLHGASSLAIEARKQPPQVFSGAGPTPVDLGLVGDVMRINQELFTLLLEHGFTPVVACLGADAEGRLLNINADAVAHRVARAVAADHLLLVTGTPGVLRDLEDPATRIPRMTVAEARGMVAGGTVTGGMIAKLDEVVEAVESGTVGTVHILGRLGSGDLLRELEAPGSVGTALVR